MDESNKSDLMKAFEQLESAFELPKCSETEKHIAKENRGFNHFSLRYVWWNKASDKETVARREEALRNFNKQADANLDKKPIQDFLYNEVLNLIEYASFTEVFSRERFKNLRLKVALLSAKHKDSFDDEYFKKSYSKDPAKKLSDEDKLLEALYSGFYALDNLICTKIGFEFSDSFNHQQVQGRNNSPSSNTASKKGKVVSINSGSRRRDNVIKFPKLASDNVLAFGAGEINNDEKGKE